jgi:hypothetical protein
MKKLPHRNYRVGVGRLPCQNRGRDEPELRRSTSQLLRVMRCAVSDFNDGRPECRCQDQPWGYAQYMVDEQPDQPGPPGPGASR